MSEPKLGPATLAGFETRPTGASRLSSGALPTSAWSDSRSSTFRIGNSSTEGLSLLRLVGRAASAAAEGSESSATSAARRPESFGIRMPASQSGQSALRPRCPSSKKTRSEHESQTTWIRRTSSTSVAAPRHAARETLARILAQVKMDSQTVFTPRVGSAKSTFEIRLLWPDLAPSPATISTFNRFARAPSKTILVSRSLPSRRNAKSTSPL